MKCLAFIIIVICAIISAPFARCYFESTRYLKLGQASLAQLNTSRAITELSQSIRFSSRLFPANQATQLLFESAIKIDQPDLKRTALIELKSALIASGLAQQTSVVSLEQIEDLLRQSYGASDVSYLANEGPKPSYNISFQIWAGVSFIAWLAFSIAAIWRGIRPNGTLKARPAFGLLILALGSMLSWLVLLSKA